MSQHEIVRDIAQFDQKLLSTLQNRERACDVEIIFNKERMLLNSIILAENCKYFEVNLFSFPLVPRWIEFENVDTEAFKKIIDYFYTGKMKLNDTEIFDVLKTAEILKIDFLMEKCRKFILTMLDVKNCFESLTNARRLGFKALENDIFDFIISNFKEISKLDDFLKLDLVDFSKILESIKDMCLDSEALTSIKKWINFDPVARKENLMSLLGYVHLEHLPFKITKSEALEICQYDGQCFHLFVEGMQETAKTCSPESKLVAIGGDSLSQSAVVEIYKESKIWQKHTVNIKKTHFESVFCDRKIFTIGGNGPLKSVESYDPKTWSMESVPNMIFERQHFAAVVVGHNIFAIGGYGKSNNYLSCAERYNVKTKKWTEISPMPTGRSYIKAAIIDNEIYVVGGTDGDYLNVNECYSVSTGRWRTCASMQEKRRTHGVAAKNHHLYVVGGFNTNRYLSTVERYDSKVDKWTYLRSITDPCNRVGLINFEGNLMLAGGSTGNNINTVKKYKEETDQWEPLTSLNVARCDHNLLAVPKNIF